MERIFGMLLSAAAVRLAGAALAVIIGLEVAEIVADAMGAASAAMGVSR